MGIRFYILVITGTYSIFPFSIAIWKGVLLDLFCIVRISSSEVHSVLGNVACMNYIKQVSFHQISSRYTTSTRGLSQIHEAMLDNPEGVARGII